MITKIKLIKISKTNNKHNKKLAAKTITKIFKRTFKKNHNNYESN